MSEFTVNELKAFFAIREKILNMLLKEANSFVDNDTDHIEMCCDYKETKFLKNTRVNSIHEPIYSAKVIGEGGKVSKYIFLNEEQLVNGEDNNGEQAMDETKTITIELKSCLDCPYLQQFEGLYIDHFSCGHDEHKNVYIDRTEKFPVWCPIIKNSSTKPITIKRPYWRSIEKDGVVSWQYRGQSGIYGTVEKANDIENEMWIWSARVMLPCRLPRVSSPPPTGKALSLEGAKKVVELLCEVTGTLTDRDRCNIELKVTKERQL